MRGPSSRMKTKNKNYIPDSEIIQSLEEMLQDNTFNTLPGYSIDTEAYPDNKIPFIENHMDYLRKHPNVNPEHYLSNLKIMLKIR